MTDNNVIGDRIRMLRKKSEMTQEQLGAILGVQKSVVAKYENGHVTNLKMTTIKKIADTFNVSPLYIMGFIDDTYISSKKELLSVIELLSEDQISVLLATAKAMVK